MERNVFFLLCVGTRYSGREGRGFSGTGTSRKESCLTPESMNCLSQRDSSVIEWSMTRDNVTVVADSSGDTRNERWSTKQSIYTSLLHSRGYYRRRELRSLVLPLLRLRKVYPYYFTFTTFTKGRWVGEKILDVFAREFRAHPAEEYERCIKAGTLTVNYEKVDVDYKLKHNDLLANVVHRHEVPVTSEPITIVHMDEDIVVVNKPASIPVHPCGRYRHNTVVFILAKEYNLKNLRTIHRLDRLTSGLLLFGRTPKKARSMEHQIRNRQVQKEYVCRVEGDFPNEIIECQEPIEVVSYKIGVCKVSPKGKTCTTTFQKLGFNGKTSIISCKPHTGRMHQIRVHLQYLGYPVVNDPLYNHTVFGPEKGRGGNIGKTDEELIRDLINIHNAENWLGMDGDSELSMFKPLKGDLDDGKVGNETCLADEDGDMSREASPCEEPCENDVQPEPSPVVVMPSRTKVTVATQTGHEVPDLTFNSDKMTTDQHCYECKVRYRDPKPKDLVMYLHAWKYQAGHTKQNFPSGPELTGQKTTEPNKSPSTARRVQQQPIRKDECLLMLMLFGSGAL
uniref:Pseudouridylate synthase RPUSD2 n=1 Tax=Timema californicum TaxID=61474 RepID=A0A7R9IXX0_TIMCA|nr:unnamed protein product [Timema californicum]